MFHFYATYLDRVSNMSSWASTQTKYGLRLRFHHHIHSHTLYHFIQIKSCMICTHTWLSRLPSQVTRPLSPLHSSDTNLCSPWTILLCNCDRFVCTHGLSQHEGSYRGRTCRRISSEVVLQNHKLHRFCENHQSVAPALATQMLFCPWHPIRIYINTSNPHPVVVVVVVVVFVVVVVVVVVDTLSTILIRNCFRTTNHYTMSAICSCINMTSNYNIAMTSIWRHISNVIASIWRHFRSSIFLTTAFHHYAVVVSCGKSDLLLLHFLFSDLYPVMLVNLLLSWNRIFTDHSPALMEMVSHGFNGRSSWILDSRWI